MEKQELPSPPLIQTKANFFEEHILAEFIIISWVTCLWDMYLEYRQRRLMKALSQMPPILDNILTPDVYEKSRIYGLDRSTVSIVKDIYLNILNTIFMTCGGLYYSWIWGQDLVKSVGLDPNSEIYTTAGCVTILRILSTVFCSLPFTIYETFVLEQKHNFNNQTVSFFIKDQIKKFIVSFILMLPLICAMIWIIKNAGDYFFIYLWLFSVFMSLLLMIVYPEFIAPLFDKYTPLPEGNLKHKIEELASSLKFPLYKLYMVEGSQRSCHSNAYLYGFGKYKRIVLFDTLIAEYQIKKNEEKEKEETENNTTDETVTEKNKEKEIRGCNTDEIISVLGHELGHWRYNHAVKSFVYGQIILFLNFFIFSQIFHYKPIYEAFEFTDSQPILIGLMLIMTYVLGPINKLLTLGLTANARYFEFQADEFAKNLGHAENLKGALIKLHKDNLGYPLFDSLYSKWHHTHPPLLERLDALKKDE